MEVEVRVLDPRLERWAFPSWGSDLAAGLDLYACLDEPLELQPHGQPVLIPSGLAIHIGDPDWCALVVPRSGLGHKAGLVLGNTIGVIDADYTGPCMISAWNRNPASSGIVLTINPGDRIAQMVFTRITRPSFKIVPEFSRTSARGAGGFGSTGV